MPISFELISASKRTPGIDTEMSLKGGSRGLASNRQRLMLVGQRMSALISVPSFVAGTLNDCVLGTNAAYTGSAIAKVFVEITTAAATDVFRWSSDNGATWTTGVDCSTANTALENGITIKFGAATGHALGDKWTFAAFPAGTVAQKVPTSFQSLGEVESGCGAGSVLYRMAKAALATAENYGIVDLSFTSVDDGAGNAASGSATVSGTATAPGYLRLRIGNERFEVGFAIGDTAEEIALALKGELDKAVEDLPVLVHRLAGTLGRLVFTAKNLGTLGNDILFATEYTPNAGISVANVALSGGATDPSNFADALDAFQSTRYHVICTAFADATNLSDLTTHLDAVSSPNVQKFAIGIFGTNNATLSVVTSLASAVNHMRAQCKYLRGSLSSGHEIAAAYAALKTYVEDPALPLNDFQLFGLNVPAVASQLIDAEVETCLQNGVSPLKVDEQGRVAVVRSITTDIAHGSMLDVTTICSLDYFRYACIARCKEVFVRTKNLSKTPENVRSQFLFVAQKLDTKDQTAVLRDVDLYKDQFTAEQDVNDPARVNVSVPSPVVPGLQRTCARFDLVY